MDTVYFAVPNRFFERYGKLQRIKAEWYEFKTADIVVTSNADFYNKASPYIGVTLASDYSEDIGISLGQNAGDWGGGVNGANWGWNLGEYYLHPACNQLCYLFKVANIEEYDPYAAVTEIGGVKSNELYSYILNYKKSFEKGGLDIKDGKISADLFADDIDEYRKMDNEFGKIQKGYSYYDFDADVDLQKLSSWQDGKPSFWDNWVNWGLWNAMTGGVPEETSKTVSPIYTLKASDLIGEDEDISDNLFVNCNDVDEIKKYYNTAKLEDKTVVLFRFATSDYYSAAVDIVEIDGGFLWNDKIVSGEAYRAWESVFFDFDIIQLTFNKDGVYTVIPVVSSPIDIVNDITPPVYISDGLDLWRIILSLLMIILLVVVIIKLVPVFVQICIRLFVPQRVKEKKNKK